MSVRRLAEDTLQPASFAFTRANAAWAKETIRKYPKGREASAVILLLMRAQEQEGWVTRAAIEAVAGMLDMPLIRVLEVATFYTQFQLQPVGTSAHIQVCGTTPCALRGAGDLIELCKRRIHAEPLHLNEAGTLSWEEVECQGACVNAPMAMIFKDTYEDLTPESLERIIDAFEAGKGDTIAPGPQIDRIHSAPASGLTSLTDEAEVTVKAGGIGAGAKARAAKASNGAKVPPSKAAKPKTYAAETDKTIAAPAPAKPAADGRPAAIERPAAPDDLKMISGVGPKNEKILNDLGIYTYRQIASWKKAERAWVDDHLNFRGRIDREDWVKQAKALAKGGAAEYERVFGKKPR